MIGTVLSHYRITAAIGAGGMGEVYRATDTKLGRDVALKLLPPDMASRPERLERFRREAKALAALDHPGIVTVYSVEEADGFHFLTMQLVDGQPLDRLIPKEGLPLEQLLAIASALADALAAAHDKGIEEVSGLRADHRTDIFSLGVIVYEMATGRRPFQGRSSAELASAILRDKPASATSIRRTLPSSLQRLIEGCLQKDPVARPQTARDLRSLLATIPGVPADPSGHPDGDEQSIAVLPFASLSPDPNDEFLADGVTEEILNALAQIPGLRVAGRRSAFSFKGRNEDLRSVGAKLGVATIFVLMARTWPSYDRLRTDPRFPDIVGRLNLPDWRAAA